MRAGLIVGIIIVFVALLGLFILTQNPSGSGIATDRIYSSKYGVSFRYPISYVLEEHNLPGAALRVRHMVTLVRQADLPAPQNGEGPVAITVGMYQNNLDRQTAERWIRGSNDSNFKLSPDDVISSTTLSGREAFSYRWSGLYEGRTIVVGTDDWIYTFSVTSITPQDDIIEDFEALLKTIEFQ